MYSSSSDMLAVQPFGATAIGWMIIIATNETRVTESNGATNFRVPSECPETLLCNEDPETLKQETEGVDRMESPSVH